MPIVSIVFGGLLIALGVWGYVATDAKSITALIPAFAGGLLALLGGLALVERFLKHAMHAAAMIGLLGFVAAGGRLVPKLMRDGVSLDDPGTVAIGGMTVLCGLFVVLCVNSFIQVRRRRSAREAGPIS